MLRFGVAAVHILSLALGVVSNTARIVALGRPLDERGIRTVLAADNLGGVIAITWVGSGLWRAFGGLEKGTAYYLGNGLFLTKMALLLVALGLETYPMITFIRWRYAQQRGEAPDVSRQALLRRLLVVELGCTLAMIVCAVGMAQGLGARRAEGPPTASEVFSTRCVPCHDAAARTVGLSLAEPERVIGARSSQWPDRVLVVPGDPDASLLVQKVRGTHADKGGRMPPAGALDAAELQAVEAWVRDAR